MPNQAAKIGRPNIGKLRRSDTITVPVNESEKKKIRRAAEAAGMPVANWLRFVALQKAEVSRGS